MPTDEITAAAAGTWTLGDRTVHRMGFGSMRITANPDRDRAVGVLRRAVELGVNHIDTAAFYFSPGGTLRVGTGPARYATELIREALAPYPEDLVIATKVGPGTTRRRASPGATPAQLRAQVEENLRRLGRDQLDVVNLRIGQEGPAPTRSPSGSVRSPSCAHAGLIRHLGLSNVRARPAGRGAGIAPVVCVQNSYGVDTYREQDEFVRALRGAGRRVRAVLRAGRHRAGGGRERRHTARPSQAVARAHGVTAASGTPRLDPAPGPARAGHPRHRRPHPPGAEHSRPEP